MHQTCFNTQETNSLAENYIYFYFLYFYIYRNLKAMPEDHDITQITLKSELLSQIRGSDVVLRDRIHRDSRITQ